jgi:hypothetical protein
MGGDCDSCFGNVDLNMNHLRLIKLIIGLVFQFV